jgi:hypothetical protein
VTRSAKVVIIRRLEFLREDGSDKHVRDICDLLALADVNRALLEREIAQRGLGDVWRKCI